MPGVPPRFVSQGLEVKNLSINDINLHKKSDFIDPTTPPSHFKKNKWLILFIPVLCLCIVTIVFQIYRKEGASHPLIVRPYIKGRIETQRELDQFFKHQDAAKCMLQDPHVDELIFQYMKNDGLENEFTHFLNREDKAVFLLSGRAGSGKSSFLKKTVMEYWEDYAETKSEYVCLFMHMPTCQTIFGNHGFLERYGINASIFKKYIENKKLIILLDGYDEIPSNKYLSKKNYVADLIEEVDCCVKIVVACRDEHVEKNQKYINALVSVRDDKEGSYLQRCSLKELDIEAHQEEIEAFLSKKIQYIKNRINKIERRSCFDSVEKYIELFDKYRLTQYINTPFMLNLMAEIAPSLGREITQTCTSKFEMIKCYVNGLFKEEWNKRELSGNTRNVLITADTYKGFGESIQEANFERYMTCIGKTIVKEMLRSTLVYEEGHGDNDFWKAHFEVGTQRQLYLDKQPFYPLLECLPLTIKSEDHLKRKRIEFNHEIFRSYFIAELFKEYLDTGNKEELRELMDSHLFTQETLGLITSLKQKPEYKGAFEERKEIIQELRDGADWTTAINMNGWLLVYYDEDRIDALNKALLSNKIVGTGANGYCEIIFCAHQWREYFGEVGDTPPLPDHIEEILEAPCPYWGKYGKKVKDTHMLTLVPETINCKPLTLRLLGELIKNPQKGYSTHYAEDGLTESFMDTPVEHAYWILMTKDVVPNSRCMVYEDQEKILQTGYRVPKGIEAAISILTHYVRYGEYLYLHGKERASSTANCDWFTFTRCQEKKGSARLIVGGFGSAGLFVVSAPILNTSMPSRGISGRNAVGAVKEF